MVVDGSSERFQVDLSRYVPTAKPAPVVVKKGKKAEVVAEPTPTPTPTEKKQTAESVAN